MMNILQTLCILVVVMTRTLPISAKTVSAIPANNPKLATAKRIRNQKVDSFPSPPKSSEAAWLSGLKNSLASSLAAASSKIILAPFDTIKTLQQHSRSSVSADPLSLIEAAQVILKRPRGVLELYVSLQRRRSGDTTTFSSCAKSQTHCTCHYLLYSPVLELRL